ncbi:efflux RND transporter periplasmic adaptor subunit [Paenisporosarcina sp. NPDC076898]|uniref:efflux RND transporter periplasmic adaptor subunit n=1 Tax=unclassified Paenisporosarcina TaxID=2642018 RepID=UPI003CFD7149
MNKWLTIGISVAVSAFLGANAILLFSDKSVISKDVYVHDYERLAAGDFEESLPKESLVAPLDTTTVYVESEDTIQDWLVKEGDAVNAGDELATLNTSTADEQRKVWESEKTSLERQVTELNTTISTLQSDRATAQSTSSSTGNATDNVTENTDDQTVNVDVNVDVGVDVSQDGAFAQAIAEAQQKLSEVNQQLQVVNAQLAQEGAAAIISPVEGIVSTIRDKNDRLAIEIYSIDKIIVTYATDEQWQDVQADDRVRLQADGMEQSLEGTVTQVSQVPAQDSEFLTAYKALEPKEHKNPLAYYEVRIQPKEPITNLPFGNNTNAMVLVNEAQKAVAVQSAWLNNRFDKEATAYVVNKDGLAVKTPVTIAFDLKTRSIITEGLKAGSVVVYEPQINDYRYAPAIFYPMPMESPSWESVKTFGWKNYLKYLVR